ncbi:unnamed protein product [Schistosoma turkestanicum]|nr:unnamed protein product [Schistosoma turkestanicum]
MLVQTDNMNQNNKDGEPRSIQASVEIKQYPKKKSVRSTKHSHAPRSSNRARQRSLNRMFCGCLVSGSECGNIIEHPPLDNNRRLLPTSAIQSMESLSISKNSDSQYFKSSQLSNDSGLIRLQPVVNLPSCALITDALLSQTKRANTVKDSSPSNGLKRSTWHSFRFNRKKEKNLPKAKHDYTLGVTVARPLKINSSNPEGEKSSEVDQSLVFSPPPNQVLLETGSPGEKKAALLGPRSETDKSKKCFVIDLDETLVHSSFKVIEHADFKVGVEIDGVTHRVYVLKRPHVDLFLSTMADLYECVLFTASLAKYADPVADFIDKWHAFRFRLFRESCVYHRGNYVKDLSHLGRPINQVVILDNSPASYMFHASHAVQISSWFDDANDRALLDLIPYFEKLATQPDVVDFLKNNIPPTPYAAVGTVGLPPGNFTHTTFSATTTTSGGSCGKSSDASSIISNIRRPNVSSPLPISIEDNHVQVSKESPATSTVSISVENKTHHLTSTDGINVVTKSNPTSISSSTLTPVVKTDEKSSSSAPLSLASYVPATSLSASVSTTKTIPINSVKPLESVLNVSTSNESTQPQTSVSLGISSLPSTSKSTNIPSRNYPVQSFSMGHKTSLTMYQKKLTASNKLFGTVSNCFKLTPPTQAIENHHSSPTKLITPTSLTNTTSTSSSSLTTDVTHSFPTGSTPKINHFIKNQ